MPDLSAYPIPSTDNQASVGTALVAFTLPLDCEELHVRLHDAAAAAGVFALGADTVGVTLDDDTWTLVYKRNPKRAISSSPVVYVAAGTAASNVDWAMY